MSPLDRRVALLEEKIFMAAASNVLAVRYEPSGLSAEESAAWDAAKVAPLEASGVWVLVVQYAAATAA